MSTNSPRDTERLDLKRQAFLLAQLNSARDGHLSRAEANKRIPKQIQEELVLAPSAANEFRRVLVSRGLLTASEKKSPSYSLTDAGRDWLRANDHFVPLMPAKGKVNPAADAATEQQRVTRILLQLVDVTDEGKSPAELNKKLGPTSLKWNAATARHIRADLNERQLIATIRTARSEKFVLTSAGFSHLATLSFDDLGKLTLNGSGLTRLLCAARQGVKSSASPTAIATSHAKAAPTTSELEAAIWGIFSELLRERYANTKLVPIHEVRDGIRRRFTDAAAAHEIFDPVLLGMRRSKKLAMLSISDRSRATADQLRDSIVGVGETFFFLEAAHASSPG